MSVKPPLNCPPDYSILVFRIAECKKAAVVKGVNMLASLDLNSIYIPIQQHTEGTLLLEKNSTKKINIDDIAEKWPMQEKYEFYVNLSTYPSALGDGTSHSYSLFNEDLTSVETINFTVDANDVLYKDFPTALVTAVENSVNIKLNVSLNGSSALTTGSTFVTAIKKGKKFRHIFNFDTTGTGALGPYAHPGNLITPFVKYKNGAVKYILVLPDYDKVDTSTCGCADSSGDMRSNKKYFEYAQDGEYDMITNPVTPIYLDGGILGNNFINWKQSSVSHIGYHLKVGDLISTVENPLFRAVITDIDGYKISIDQTVSSVMIIDGQQTQHTYSPSAVSWKTLGDFGFFSGATDIYDADKCFIETIILNNPHNFDIPVRYMIGR
jgi:hypothetical protein